MPQLDITILLPQTFFLFFFFILFYILLAYVLLPKFLTVLKLRRNVSEKNLSNLTTSLSSLTSSTKQIKLQKNLGGLQKNFQLVTKVFTKHSVTIPFTFDNNLSAMILHSLLFTDTVVLKNIKILVKGLNFKN